MMESQQSFLRRIIFKGDTDPEAEKALREKGITVISWDNLIKLGKENPAPHNPPKPNDLALIMWIIFNIFVVIQLFQGLQVELLAFPKE